MRARRRGPNPDSQAVLVLIGETDLMPLAAALHRVTIGPRAAVRRVRPASGKLASRSARAR